ncbi:MAG TPA: vWA domain-containing protein [Candidatus Acidoferrales bacterium]|nr:vWA domain-containing protein [Candidatus Acidoferrales bacterium]
MNLRWLRCFFFVLLLCLLLVPPLAPQQAAPPAEIRVIPLGIFDAQDNPLPDITADQLRIRGVEAEWKLAPALGPRKVVLLLDVTSSMSSYGNWERAEAFATSFISLLDSDVELALHTYGEFTQERSPFTLHHQSILAAVQAGRGPNSQPLSPKRDYLASLFKGLVGAAEPQLDFGDAIVLVAHSVGPHPLGPVDSFDTLARELSSRGIRLFCIAVGEPYTQLMMGRYPPVIYRTVPFLPSLIVQLVAATGGSRYHYIQHRANAVPGLGPQFSEDDIPLVARSVNALLKNCYRLELSLRKPLKKRTDLKIEVRDQRGKKRKDVVLLYPTVLYPLPPQSTVQSNQ